MQRGSEHDERAMERLFDALGYNVTARRNLTAQVGTSCSTTVEIWLFVQFQCVNWQQMTAEIKGFAAKHDAEDPNVDSCVVCVMGHGSMNQVCKSRYVLHG